MSSADKPYEGPTLVAVATSAGIYPEGPHFEDRPYRNRVAKGGYINLTWENIDHSLTERTIHVTTKRAFQAMNNIEKRREVA